MADSVQHPETAGAPAAPMQLTLIEDGLPTFTEQQQLALARRREPLLVSAGAGSGKTAVLVERFVAAVREDGLAPARILAITFTERAAGELRERVRARLLELGERAAAQDTEAAFISTFHGFCARLLRGHALQAGLEPDFEILDEVFAARTRARAFATALSGFLAGERAPAVDLVAACGAERLRSMLWRTYARLRSRGERRPQLPKPPAGGEPAALQACALLDELLERFGQSYEALKHEHGALDFDDLELEALALLERRPGLRRTWSERFELLMVDEFQDTNPRQLALLGALERENLFTVGDELQAIYGFRDADVSLFRARHQELAARGASIELRENFRSDPALIEVVNAAFGARLEGRYQPLLAARAGAGGEHAVELLLTGRRGWNGNGGGENGAPGGVPAWRRAEAALLAERVARLVEDGTAHAGEVAVLLRALGDVEVYERELQLRGLRTLAAAGGFWRRQQVRDLLAYLRTLANPLDELALYGTLASPLVGLSSDALALLAGIASERGLGAWAAIERAPEELAARLPETDWRSLSRFGEHLRSEREAARRRTVSQLLERAIEHSGYRAHVLALDSPERRLANIDKLLHQARRFEAREGRDLRGFLDHVAELQQLGESPEPDAPVAGVEPDAVRLMSIHAAKGLEFPVVCVADLGRAPNLTVGELLCEGERIGLRLPRLDAGDPEPWLDYAELCLQSRREQAEEEDRVLYVAMTRARERLLLSGAVELERWPEQREGLPPIAWLAPAIAPELPELARSVLADGGAGVQTLELRVGSGRATRVRCLLNLPGGPAAGPGQVSAGAGEAGQSRAAGYAEPGPSAATHAQPGPSADRAGASGTRPPERDDRVPAPFGEGEVLSYTTLGELERCGYRYYLERVLGLEEDRAAARRGSGAGAGGISARARGTLAHRLLEAVDFARPVSPSREQADAAALELGIEATPEELEQIAALVAAPAGLEPWRRVAAARQVRREHPFVFSLGAREPLLTGVIDVLAREADGAALVLDYKTDEVSGDVDLAALVEREYALQRLLYALAVLREGTPAVEIVHWFLRRPEEWVSARFAMGERAALEEELAERIEQARLRGFAVSPEPHRGLCETCPGRSALCSWDEAQTLRDLPLPEPSWGAK